MWSLKNEAGAAPHSKAPALIHVTFRIPVQRGLLHVMTGHLSPLRVALQSEIAAQITDGRILPFVEYVPKDEAALQVYEASAMLLSAHIGQNCNIYPQGLFEAERRRFRKKDSLAAFGLGMMHKEGVGVKKDYKKTFKYWRLGSLFGNVYAMTGLALCYKEGMGVEKDPYLERHWYEKAAKR